MSLFLSDSTPLRCDACDGEGELPYKLCHHGIKCPCDEGSTECPDCRGGIIQCATCATLGEKNDAVAHDADGEPACPDCLAAEADELLGECLAPPALRVLA